MLYFFKKKMFALSWLSKLPVLLASEMPFPFFFFICPSHLVCHNLCHSSQPHYLYPVHHCLSHHLHCQWSDCRRSSDWRRAAYSIAWPFTSPFTTWMSWCNVINMIWWLSTLSKSTGAVGRGLLSFFGSFSCSWTMYGIPYKDIKLIDNHTIPYYDIGLQYQKVGNISWFQDSRISKRWTGKLDFTCSHFFVHEGRWMPMLRDPKSLPQI